MQTQNIKLCFISKKIKKKIILFKILFLVPVCDSFNVSSISNCDVHWSIKIFHRSAQAIGDVVFNIGETFGSLIGMDVTGQDQVNFAVNKPRLKRYPHALTFHVMVVVAVVPRRVNNDNQPWSLLSVHVLQLLLQPQVLWCVFAW